MADGKVPTLLMEAIDSYIPGNFFSTIALCGMTAERLCYYFIDFVDIRIGEKLLNDEQKQILYKLPYNSLVEFFWKIGSFNDSTRSLMFQISEIRNRHIHPTMIRPAEDAIKILNLLCKVLEEKLSIFQFYDITLERRARTIRSWFRWIRNNLGLVEVDAAGNVRIDRQTRLA